MAKILWDQAGDKKYETGVDHGVLYVKKDTTVDVPLGNNKTSVKTPFHGGVAWNGLTSVSKSPSGAEANDIYADNIKYASLRSAETFGGTIEAYTYPDEFAECDGSKAIATGVGVYLGQQTRKPFGFCFRTDMGDDNDGSVNVNNKYKIHLIYNATASPSESSYSTINDSPEAITFSWELTTIPVSAGDDNLPTATITIDSTKFTDIDQTTGKSTKLTAFEEILYGKDPTTEGGNDGRDPMLPMPEDVIKFFTT